MEYRNDDAAKRPCAFVIKMTRPLFTLTAILHIMIERNIRIDTLQHHNMNNDDSILIIHCLIERDRIRHVQGKLEKIKGIAGVELLESRGTNIIKV